MERTYRRVTIRRRLAWFAAAGLLAATALSPGATALAAEPTDMVRVWNEHAVNALSNAATATPPGAGYSPPVASSHLAMVQGAVYDAVNAIDGGHEPYLATAPTGPATASKAAAAATAAYRVLIDMTPTLSPAVEASLTGFYNASLAQVTDGSAKTAGIQVGTAAAAAMLTARIGDNRFAAYSFVTGTLPGEWRPVLPAFVSDPNAWVAIVRPFTMTSNSQFRTEGPLDMTSAQYAAEFNEVKAKGALNNSTRTPAETALGMFFSGNPLPVMNRTFRELSVEHGLSIVDDARLFALSSMSSADALIGCWDDKKYWNFWRPITAIRMADQDGNAATVADPNWLPLLPTPPYPDHPSGFNCYSAGMMYAGMEFFRTNRMDFRLTLPNGTYREYHRFNQVLHDTIDARIYLGFHFRAPDVQGAWLGKKVAQYASKHYFEPVD